MDDLVSPHGESGAPGCSQIGSLSLETSECLADMLDATQHKVIISGERSSRGK